MLHFQVRFLSGDISECTLEEEVEKKRKKCGFSVETDQRVLTVLFSLLLLLLLLLLLFFGF